MPEITRRGLLKGLLGLPAVALLGREAVAEPKAKHYYSTQAGLHWGPASHDTARTYTSFVIMKFVTADGKAQTVNMRDDGRLEIA